MRNIDVNRCRGDLSSIYFASSMQEGDGSAHSKTLQKLLNWAVLYFRKEGTDLESARFSKGAGANLFACW